MLCCGLESQQCVEVEVRQVVKFIVAEWHLLDASAACVNRVCENGHLVLRSSDDAFQLEGHHLRRGLYICFLIHDYFCVVDLSFGCSFFTTDYTDFFLTSLLFLRFDFVELKVLSYFTDWKAL